MDRAVPAQCSLLQGKRPVAFSWCNAQRVLLDPLYVKFPIFLSLALVARIVAAAPNTGQPLVALTPNERWVVNRLNSGQDADLTDQECPDKTRKLTGRFIQGLLSNSQADLAVANDTISISNAVINDPIRLVGGKVGYNIYFYHCEFNQGVQFQGTAFAGEVSFDESVFKGWVEFDHTKFAQLVTFRGVDCRGPLTFWAADCGADFIADGIRCSYRAYFRDLKVKGSGSFDESVFKLGADFELAEIGTFRAEDAVFERIAEANFAGMKVKHDLSIRRAKFQAMADFRSIDIGGTAALQRSQFNNPGAALLFNGGKVGSDLSLDETEFTGAASFEEARIGRDFSALDVEFPGGLMPAADFTRMDCGGACRIRPKGVAGELKFLYAILGDLQVRPLTAAEPITINLFGATIHRTLTIEDAAIATMLAGQLHVEGPATFKGVKFSKQADFAYSDFADLHLHSVIWPASPDLFRIEGMKYRAFEAGNDRETKDFLLTLADKAKYSAAVYADLSNYFQHQGSANDADNAFIAGKRRERKQHGLGVSRSASWLLDILIGYGRHPERVGFLCISIVALGCWLFPRRYMVEQKKGVRRTALQSLLV